MARLGLARLARQTGEMISDNMLDIKVDSFMDHSA
jgi:hypothetical protein